MGDEEKIDRRKGNPNAGRPPGRKNNKTIAKESKQAAIAKNREKEMIRRKEKKTQSNGKAEDDSFHSANSG